MMTELPVADSGARAVVIGVSSGGFEALSAIIPALSSQLQVPVLVAYHRGDDSSGAFTERLNRLGPLQVSDAMDKQPTAPGAVVFAPAGYHLLVEQDFTLSLSVDARVNHSRPSIDVLFESAADVWQDGLVGLILTGASRDGAAGLLSVVLRGGMAIVQDPTDAEMPVMPEAAIQALGDGRPFHKLALQNIAPLLNTLCV